MTPRPPAAPPSELARAALAQLRRNDLGAFVKPAERQYPHQWNWDAAFVALGLSETDPERARGEVRSLLRGAWADGMVPHILYHGGASDYRPAPEFWRTEGRHPTGLPTSGLSQPPILASCLRRMHDLAADAERPAWRAFLAEAYPAVLAWHRWWHRARDPEGRGLVAILHPWESGTDDAPRFVGALARIAPRDVPAFERGDRTHVDPAERPGDADYARFVHLIDVYRRRGWEAAALWEDAPFKVVDPFVNAVLHRADGDLAAIADELGEPRDEIDRWRAATEAAFPRLWSEASGTFEAWDARAERPLDDAGVAGFAPLWAGLADARQVSVLREAFDDPQAYAPADEHGFRLPTSAKNGYFFAPRRYWRGPVWINANWMLAHGFAEAGMPDAARTLRRDALTLLTRHGFWEHYDPRDGTPGGARGFSWSAALALVLGREAAAAGEA
jgi:glycogen debranching enzyme